MLTPRPSSGWHTAWAEKTLPRDTRDTLFLLANIAWVVALLAPHLPWWCWLMTMGVLIWRGLSAWRGQPLPGQWWRLGLLGVAMAATLATHRTLLGRDPGVTMVVVLLALKTLEMRARRDAFVIFFLSFFTLLSNFFFSQSLLTAAAILGDNTNYWVGRLAGPRIFAREDSLLFKRKHLAQAEEFYARHGSNLSGIRRWLYERVIRHGMNRNVARVRASKW